ncbi:hypothetical protein ACFPH6_38030 [Streptomyces xiangluensis]|uniref:Mycothiol-dependent maleylpyruvate isomerase metal-binding domain-containing protein n=1 Tax=Streptomyces xiangluensis TaxID=2665720 RepID=A0ABV8Z498_9ACTN
MTDDRICTPHKAIRGIADHLVDHLAELEPRSRLTRLARIWANRLGTPTPEQLDHSPGDGWTLRQLAFHLTGSTYYADAVGDPS